MPFRLFAAKRRQAKWCHAKREHPYHLSMVNIRSNVHKNLHFCDRDMKRIPSLYMQRTNGHSYVRGKSRIIVLFLCTSSDHVFYFKVWPWRSLTDLVITINSAYHLSIRKVQKAFTGEGDMERTREVRWQMDIWWTGRQTDRQANRRTDNITTNNIILPVLRLTRGNSVLWRLFREVVTRLLWKDHQIWQWH